MNSPSLLHQYPTLSLPLYASLLPPPFLPSSFIPLSLCPALSKLTLCIYTLAAFTSNRIRGTYIVI